jgi:phosphoglycolate phosphatase-like HAD superfamily hydrolase
MHAGRSIRLVVIKQFGDQRASHHHSERFSVESIRSLVKGGMDGATARGGIPVRGVQMRQAVIFDVDGTLIDSVDLHARAWHEAFLHFGHDVTLAQARGQIGKGGDQLLPVFLSEAERKDHGEDLEDWRSRRFKTEYLPLVRPFSGVPELLERVRRGGLTVAVASSSKKEELEKYLEIAGVAKLVEVATTSDDAERSKPAPDIFESALSKLDIDGANAIAVGDTPYDAEAAGKRSIRTIGVLCGGFAGEDLRRSGCIAVYQSPSALLADYDRSPLRNWNLERRQGV